MRREDTHWFVTVAKDTGLRCGDARYFPHPGCTDNPKAWVYHNAQGIGFYCNKCGRTGFRYHAARTMRELLALRQRDSEITAQVRDVRLPEGTTEFPALATVWLARAGIPHYQAVALGMRWSDYYERVFIPCYNGRGTLTYYQGRAVDGRHPKYVNPRVDKGRVLYRPPTGAPWDFGRPVLVTEDILSAARCDYIIQSTSLLGTKLAVEQEVFLGRFPTVLVWLDGDSAGQRGRTKIRKALSWYTRVVLIETPLDPKLYPDHIIKEIVHGSLGHDTPGVYRPRLPEM